MVSIQFAKDPTQYIIHNDRAVSWGKVETDMDKMNASWIVVPSLSGAAGCVSFMAYNDPDMFLATNDYQLQTRVDDRSASTAYSYCPVSTVGTTSPTINITNQQTDNVRFRASQYNTRYIRALYELYGENGLFVAQDGVVSRPTPGDTPMNFAQDIVWNVVEGFALAFDKAALQALVDEVNAMNSGWFLNWAYVMTNPLAFAQDVLDTYGGPPPPVIQAAYDALQAAIAALQPIMSDVVLGIPVVTGDPMVGHTLTVTASTFPLDAILSYEWLVGGCATGTVIPGETANTYVVQASDAGLEVCARVTASLSPWFNSTWKFSAPVEIQVPIQVQKAELPATAMVGQTLTIDLAYTPTDATYTVEWFRNGTELIAGANSLTYTVQQYESGGTLVAKITISKPGWDTVEVFANVVQIGGVVPPNGTVTLSPAGPVAPGTVLTLTYDVTPVDAFVIAEWYVGGNVVWISTNPYDGNTYTPTAADSGKAVVVKLTVYAPSFSPVVLFSNSVDVT
jgi:hypothetical protein